MNVVNCELVEFFKLFIVKYILWKIVFSLTSQWRSKYANFCFFGDQYVFNSIGQNEANVFLGSYRDAKMSILQHIFHYNQRFDKIKRQHERPNHYGGQNETKNYNQ